MGDFARRVAGVLYIAIAASKACNNPDTVQCEFQPGTPSPHFCSWQRVQASSNWGVFAFNETPPRFYAVAFSDNSADMTPKEAILKSSLQCSTGDKIYQLGFRYYIEHARSKFSVILDKVNGSAQALWMEDTPKQWMNTEANVSSPDSDFHIIFKAEKLNQSQNFFIGLASITYSVSDLTLTTKQTTEIPTPVHTTDTTTTRPPLSATVSTTAQSTMMTSEATYQAVHTSSDTPPVTRDSTVDYETCTEMSTRSPLTESLPNTDTSNIRVGIAVGVTAPLLVIGAVMGVVVFIRRKRSADKSFCSLHILHYIKKRRNPDASPATQLRAVKPTYSQAEEKTKLRIRTSTAAADLYSTANKKNKKKTGTHENDAQHTSDNSKTSVYKIASAPPGDDDDDCFSSRDDTAASRNRKLKGDKAFDLESVNRATAARNIPRNMLAPGVAAAKPRGKAVSDGQDEYNSISHQPPSAKHHDTYTYNHLDEDLQTSSNQLTATSVYSLARVEDDGSVLSIAITRDDHVTNGQTYVNVGIRGPQQTADAEYNRLDLDRPQRANETAEERMGGEDVYSRIHDDDSEYHQLGFDLHCPQNDDLRSQDTYYHLQADR